MHDHPARKIVIYRDFDDVQDSLSAVGLPRIEDSAEEGLLRIKAPAISMDNLFDPSHAARIWRHLIGDGFCERRHRELCAMNVTARLPVVADEQLQDALWDELDD